MSKRIDKEKEIESRGHFVLKGWQKNEINLYVCEKEVKVDQYLFWHLSK